MPSTVWLDVVRGISGLADQVQSPLAVEVRLFERDITLLA